MSHNKLHARLAAIGCVVATSVGIAPARALAAGAPDSADAQVAIGLPPNAAPVEQTTQPQETNTKTDAPVVIDNDEAASEPEYQWKEIPDADGKTHIVAGARFPVIVQSAVSSATAKVGDPVEGRLNVDIKVGGKLVAQKGDRVLGHIISVEHARKLLRAEFTANKRWMRMAGALGIQFDQILAGNGDHIPLVAQPARNPRIVKNDAEGRVMGVNVKGEIASPLSGQVKAQAVQLAIRAAASAGGVFSFGIVPAAFACAGAISPSLAFQQPIGKNVRHRRLKGFGMGLVEGLPGGFLIADSIIKGPEARIEPGDVFLAEFKQDFTGEPATEADILAGAKTSVHGQILPDGKTQK